LEEFDFTYGQRPPRVHPPACRALVSHELREPS
jgi:hypothetical protein